MMFTPQAKRYNAAPVSFICRWCELGLSVSKLILPQDNFIVKKIIISLLVSENVENFYK